MRKNGAVVSKCGVGCSTAHGASKREVGCARILTYLAGLPYCGSPLIIPSHSQPTRPHKIVRDLAYIPSCRVEARWLLLRMNASRERRDLKKSKNQWRTYHVKMLHTF